MVLVCLFQATPCFRQGGAAVYLSFKVSPPFAEGHYLGLHFLSPQMGDRSRGGLFPPRSLWGRLDTYGFYFSSVTPVFGHKVPPMCVEFTFFNLLVHSVSPHLRQRPWPRPRPFEAPPFFMPPPCFVRVLGRPGPGRIVQQTSLTIPFPPRLG